MIEVTHFEYDEDSSAWCSTDKGGESVTPSPFPALLLFLAFLPGQGALTIPHPVQADDGLIVRVPSGEPIHIGVGTLLTGVEASLGREVLSGAEAFLKDHPTLLGHPLILVPLDDGCDEALTVDQARRFCSMEPRPLAVIGYLCSPGSHAALHIHTTCHLPLLNVSSADPRLTQAESPWLIRLWISRDHEALLVAKWIRSKRYSSVLLIHERDSYATAIAEAFREAIQKYAPRSRAQIMALPELKDVASSIFEGKQAPRLLYYVGRETVMLNLWKELPDKALQRPWLQDYMLESWLAENVDAPQPQELYCIALQLPAGDPLSPPYQYFRGRFGEPGVYTLAAYDAVSVLTNALQKTANTGDASTEWNMAEVMTALRETQIHGLTGSISFDDRGNRAEASGQVFRWKNGQWESQWKGTLP